MKSLLLFLALLCAVVLTTTSSAVNKSTATRKQKATMIFSQPVILQGVTLKGEYLFVHDDSVMDRGEACTRVYKGDAESPDKLVVTFHCVPIERAKAAYFIIRTFEVSPGVMELREFQFKGDTEAHGTPAFK